MSDLFDKPALRTRLRALRRTLAAENPEAGAQAAMWLPLDRLPRYRVYALYHPRGSEIDPAPLFRPLGMNGAAPTLPVAVDRDGPLQFRLWSDRMPLEPDAFGVPAPQPVMPAMTPELVIAPVLGFDRRGGRLGQGGGHYDRTLANLRARAPVFVIGLAFSGQEVSELPLEPHDQRLDAILTETEYIEVG